MTPMPGAAKNVDWLSRSLHQKHLSTYTYSSVGQLHPSNLHRPLPEKTRSSCPAAAARLVLLSTPWPCGCHRQLFDHLEGPLGRRAGARREPRFDRCPKAGPSVQVENTVDLVVYIGSILLPVTVDDDD